MLKENICKRVKPPKLEYKESAYLDEEKTRKLLEVLEKEPIMWRTMFLLFITTGCRRGEMCGFRWKDFSEENAEIRVVITSQYIAKRGIIDKEPKTRASIRVIDLPDVTVNALKEYRTWYLKRRLQVGKDWIDTDKIFTQWNRNDDSP